MKLKLTLFIALALVASIFSSNTNAQCSQKDIRKRCKSGLESYLFESAANKPFNQFPEPRKIIDAAFTVYAQENYRVLNLTEGFASQYEFVIFDTQKNKIFSNEKDPAKNKFDFTADRSGEYIIRYIVSETNNATACVSYVVGYK